MRPSSNCWLFALLATGGLGSACAPGASSGPEGGDTVDRVASVDSIVVSLDSVDIVVGDTVRLTATPVDSKGVPVAGIQLAWTSSDETVATVSSSGLVTTVDLGEAEIDVVVVGPAPASAATSQSSQGGRGTNSRAKITSRPNLAISPGTTTTDVGKTVSYAVSVTDSRGNPLRTSHPTTWSSSSATIATIDIAGKATAVGPGTTTITASVGTSFGATSKSVQLKVRVCEGLLEVVAWDATVSSGYLVGPTVPKGIDDTIRVDQSSNGTAVLTRTRFTRDSAVWTGRPTGTAHVDNTTVAPPDTNKFIARAKELGGGALAVAVSEIKVTASWSPTGSGPGSCTYKVRYVDGLLVNISENLLGSNKNLTSPLGVAATTEDAGSKPVGPWALARTYTGLFGALIPTVPDDDDEVNSLGLKKYYLPFLGIPSGLLNLTPGGKVAGARFSFTLTER